MKRCLFYIFCLCLSFPALAQYTVKGGTGEPLLAVAGGNGAVSVYLLNTLSGAEISYTSSDDGLHYWYKYNRNVNEATPISCTQDGKTSRITNVEDGWGYFVGSTTSSQTSYVWIVDYSHYKPALGSISFVEEDDRCFFLQIQAPVTAEPIYYYSGANTRNELQRKYTFLYNTMTWDKDNFMFNEHTQEMTLTGIVNEFVIDAPLMNTHFTLKGDTFSEHFGFGQSVTSTEEYEAVAIEAYAEMQHLNAPEEGGSSGDDDGMQSAPYNAYFRAAANEPTAAMFRWKIEKLQDSGDYNNITQRVGEKEFEWQFTEDGYYRIELEVTNKYATCVADTTITLSIASSELDVPNYFSPGNSSGYHTEFKVVYRSISNFKCTISNRWGNVLYTWTDPELGWDGKVSGMYVATGVYFYNIEYTNSQGKKKTKKGSINVLREVRQ